MALGSSTLLVCRLSPQALLELQATAPDGECSQDATVAVKDSVQAFMAPQPGVVDLVVTVICYNANGEQGAIARQGPAKVPRGDGARARRRGRQWKAGSKVAALGGTTPILLQVGTRTHKLGSCCQQPGLSFSEAARSMSALVEVCAAVDVLLQSSGGCMASCRLSWHRQRWQAVVPLP